MSLSSRNLRLCRVLALPCMAVAAAQANAGDGYFIPDIAVSAEHHSNYDLLPNGATSTLDQSVTGYVADVAAVAGVRSQRGFFEVRPALQFQGYADRGDLQRSNQYLDGKAEYGSQLAHFDLSARFSREDEYQFNLPQAGFNAFNPQTPDSTDAGSVIAVTDKVRRLYLEPNFWYQFSQRTAAGIRATYEDVNYNNDAGLDRVDYTNKRLEGYLLFDMGVRTKLQTGLYASRYEAERNVNTTDTLGAAVSLIQRWTPTFTGALSLSAERSNLDTPTINGDKSTNIGATASLDKRLEVSRVRFELGQYYVPSGTGTRSKLDQVRVQYFRDLKERWHAVLAARGFRTRGESENNNDRDYVRGSFDLQWDTTRTWFISGGVDYLWQKYKVDDGNRKDTTFRVRVGYRGLDSR